MKQIYLDYAAATPMDSSVVAAMTPYFTEKFYNPSNIYIASLAIRRVIDDARASVASWLGAKPSEIIFTAGGTEANNLAINGAMQAYPASNVLVSAIEHESVIKPAKTYKHKIIKVMHDGQINLNDLHRKIDDKTVLVSVMYANNEIGIVQSLTKASQIIDQVRKARKKENNTLPLYFHTDACQAANYLDLHVHRLGVDLMTINGGKIYGPKQSGALFVKTGTKIKPQILGGGQELGLRSGTENAAAIVGFVAALNLVQNGRHQESQRIKSLQNIFIKELENLSAVTINGSKKTRLPNNVNLTIPGQDNERMIMALDEKGVQCSAGSACSASNDKPSAVLSAIGLSDDQARSSLRFTLGRQTTESDIKQAALILRRLIV